MLFIKNWNKASLDKSSNSIVARYKSKISSLTDKTEALRQLLNDLYDEAVTLNDRIKIDKQAIQEDLNDTATDLRETCGNSSWGQAEIEQAQDLLDRAEEEIEDIQTDIEITTGCLVVCQSDQSCNQPCSQSCSQPCGESASCNEAGCNENAGCNEASEDPEGCFLMDSEEEEDCAVIVGGVFNCTGVNTIIDDCYGGCYNNQSCDGQKKTCPKCHGSEIDIIEICTYCETDQKTTCGSFDTQDGCNTDNTTGNCDLNNSTGDCYSKNTTGDCSFDNGAGACASRDGNGNCKSDVSGDCDTSNNATTVDTDHPTCKVFNDADEVCESFNSEGTDCMHDNHNGNCANINNKGDCNLVNNKGDCIETNSNGTCQKLDNDSYCMTNNPGNEGTCGKNDNNAQNCTIENNNGDCLQENNVGNCNVLNTTGECKSGNSSGDCYSQNETGNCQTENATGECISQSCSSGQDCAGCIEDQKETTTTEECKAGANIGEEEYCDSCQGTESSEVEISQEELEEQCGPMFEAGADACGPDFANCFNTSECDGATWGAASGCGNLEGCGGCNENNSCTDGQSCATGQVCGTNDCGQDCYESCSQPCSESCSQPCGETPPCDDSCDCDGYVPCDYGCSGYEGCEGGCDGCDGADFA